MLQAIELWDFESHEHSRIEGLSDGLNIVCGPSNSGKTSIVRALKLVAYNDFDPKSVRVGSKKCKVRVETDKGWVQVTRGKDDNLWEITPTGQKTMFRDKIGRVEPPKEAMKILGMGKVTLGDVPVPVNIMDQLESHFMLAGVGNKDATGSVRAQIIDEISGLSGIEGIIKEVSLDNRRAKRAVKQSEGQMAEINTHLHDESILKAEEMALSEAEEHLVNHQDALEAAASAKDMLSQGEMLRAQVADVQGQLAVLPDGKQALGHLENAQHAMDVFEVASECMAQAWSTNGELNEALSKLEAISDHKEAMKHLVVAGELLEKAKKAHTIQIAAERVDDQAGEVEYAMRGLPDISVVTSHFDTVQKVCDLAKDVKAAMTDADKTDQEIAGIEARLVDNRRNLEEALSEQDTLLKSIKVCPLNPAHPVSENCLDGIHHVTKEKI